MDTIELQQPAKVLANLLFDMATPPIGCEAIGTVWLLAQGNVIRPIQSDDEIAVSFVAGITPSVSIGKKGEAHLSQCQTQGVDVFNCGFNCCEVTHYFLSEALLVNHPELDVGNIWGWATPKGFRPSDATQPQFLFIMQRD